MAKSISLKIDVKGQDELFKAQQSVNQLTKEKKLLNDQYKKGKVSEKAYAKGLAKVNVNLKASKTRVRQLNKQLLIKNKLVKKSGSFTNKMAGAMGKMVIGIGIAVAGFKALAGAIGGAMEKFDAQAKAEKSLEVALGGTSNALLQQAKALQEVTRFGDEAIIQGQAYLGQMGLTEKEIGRLTPALLDMAEAQGMNVNDAFKIASKTMGSTTNALSRYGIEVTGAVGTAERMDSIMSSLNDKFSGQATAMAGLGAGPMEQMKNAWGDLMEQGGGIIYDFINPFILKITKWIPKIPALFVRVTNKVKELYNWFVDLYNEAVVFRAIVQYIKFTFKNMVDVVSNQFRLLIDIIKAGGEVIAGVFNFDWNRVKEGYRDVGKAFKRVITSTIADVKENWDDAMGGLGERTAKKLVLTDTESAEVIAEYGELGGQAQKEFDKEKDKEKNKTTTDPFTKEKADYKRLLTLKLNGLKQSLLDGRKLEDGTYMTAKKLKDKTLKAELDHLDKMKEVYKKYGKSVEEIDALILAKKLGNIEKVEEAEEVADATRLDVASQVTSALGELGDRRTSKELESLDKQKEAGVLSETEYEDRKEDIQKKAFNRKKQLDVANVIINFATANSKTFAELGFPAGLLGIPVLTGLMLGQLALIGSQQFAQGGLVGGGIFEGASHEQGGIKFASGGRLMEAEGGEAIINKKSTAMFKPLLSTINSAGGGVQFADGGILNQMKGNFDMSGMPTASTNVVVVESDITSTQNQVSTIEANASL